MKVNYFGLHPNADFKAIFNTAFKAIVADALLKEEYFCFEGDSPLVESLNMELEDRGYRGFDIIALDNTGKTRTPWVSCVLRWGTEFNVVIVDFNEYMMKLGERRKTDQDMEHLLRELSVPRRHEKKKEERRPALLPAVTDAEVRARAILRDELTEAEWRRYLTNSFIMVRGETGNWYQLSPYKNIQVWQNGENICSLCIHSDGSVPPSDHILNLKHIVENFEWVIFEQSNMREHGLEQYRVNNQTEVVRGLAG